MQTIKGIINNSNGLTSHLSVDLVSEANKYECEVTINVLEEQADLKSIMNVMALVVPNGEKFSITFDGKDEVKAAHNFDIFLTNHNLK